MDHDTSRWSGQRVHHRKGWRTIDVHDPSTGDLARLAAALLVAALALAALAVVAFAALPLLGGIGALWALRTALRRRVLPARTETRHARAPAPSEARPRPPATATTRPATPGATVYDSRVVVRQ